MPAIDDIKPGFTGQCFPELYTSRPPQPGERKPGQLPTELVEQYFEQGYLIVEDFFKKEDLDACREAINELVEQLAQRLYKGGKIKNLYKEYGLFQRLSKIEAEFPGANIILHKMGVMPKESPVRAFQKMMTDSGIISVEGEGYFVYNGYATTYSESYCSMTNSNSYTGISIYKSRNKGELWAFQDVWANERLLNVIEQFIGSDIMGHPVWNLRTKTPNNEATTVPWHQDSGYLDVDSYGVLTPTAWIPLLDTSEVNGCMQVAANGHKKGLIATHQCCHGGTWYTMLGEKEMEKTLGVDLAKDIKTCPIPYGGMLLINNHIPHQSLPNRSTDIRWTLDLRWQRSNQPVGFYGLKEGVVMRSSKDPNLKIDWDTFNNVDRNMVQRESVEDMVADSTDEFDTTITGPWMKKWEITHVNRHTQEMGDREMRDKA